MNYFQEHVGDTVLAVGHMPPLHRGIYYSLKARYMQAEAPLPDDIDRLAAWAGVRRRTERRALADVLDECFELRPDGWHVDEWDDAIAAYQRSAPDQAARRESKKSASLDRVQRHRREVKRRESALADIGVPVKPGTGIRELRALCDRHLGAEASDALRRDPVTPAVTPGAGVTAAAEIDNQEPGTITHQPHTPLGVCVVEADAVTETETRDVTRTETALQPAALAAMAAGLTAGGVPASPDHDGVRRLVAAGWTAAKVLAEAPSSWDGITSRLGWLLGKIAKQKAPAIGAPQLAEPVAHWTASTAGIIAKGVELGVGAWSEAEQVAGRQPDFLAYRRKVFQRAGVSAEAVAC